MGGVLLFLVDRTRNPERGVLAGRSLDREHSAIFSKAGKGFEIFHQTTSLSLWDLDVSRPVFQVLVLSPPAVNNSAKGLG
jgi:hypothetical protein